MSDIVFIFLHKTINSWYYYLLCMNKNDLLLRHFPLFQKSVDRIIIEEQDTPVQYISNPNDEEQQGTSNIAAVTHAVLVENNLEGIDGCAITIHPNEVAEIAEALNNKTNASTNSEESDAEEYIRKLPKLKGSKGRKKKKGENGKKKRGNKGGIVKESVNENEGHDEVIEGGDQEGGKNRVRKSTRKRKQVGKGYHEEEDEEGEGEEEEEEELEDFNIEDGDDEVLTKKKKFQLKVKLKENEGKKMKPRGRSTRKRKENDQNQEDDSNKGRSCEKEKDEEEDEVTTETESEDEIESDSRKLEEQKKIWKKGGWDIDPDTSFPRGPKLHMDDPSELDFFIHFFPMTYLREEIIPATNSFARKNRKSWNDIMEEEMLHFFGILKAMEVYKFSERRMY